MEWPVPLTPLSPYSRMVAMLTAVAPATVCGFTAAFQRSVRVTPGARSVFQVRSVLPAPVIRPGLAAAQPEGVIVQPVHGSSNPMFGPQGSSSVGIVSQICTFHQVFEGE